MQRAFYSETIENFLESSEEEILGKMAISNRFPLTEPQKMAWIAQISLLKDQLASMSGMVYFEYSIPRMGKRVDVVLICGPSIFVIEFKVGATIFSQADIDQVVDYALDLHNFHESSHDKYLVPVLVSTEADFAEPTRLILPEDKVFVPFFTNGQNLSALIAKLNSAIPLPSIRVSDWEAGVYKPTPTLIEATLALYNGHSVDEISRNEAGDNLTHTSGTVAQIIEHTRTLKQKSIIFVTGVPGAGKTLVGLDIATSHIDPADDLYSVYLSGNGPLVKILQEALARDKVERTRNTENPLKIGVARSEVKAFIQNVHHFRDEGLSDPYNPPIEHVALFDEAQRAWNKTQTVNFMSQKKGLRDFEYSEPHFLISCMDRHRDWCAIVCLIGDGQEINKGEAGILGWVEAVRDYYPGWNLYSSDNLIDPEFGGQETVQEIEKVPNVTFYPELHLSTSQRSFRSEKVSAFVKQLLDLEKEAACELLSSLEGAYPIVLTRSLDKARWWLKNKARGSERFGIVGSSQGERLKPLGVNVRAPIDPIHWFLDGKDDVRSSYYLEDAATEFHVQGLELDWVCVAWDADFRYSEDGWGNWSFRGSRWQRVKKEERQMYQKNAYRVLLTRARQGMVIVVPEGDEEDATRPPAFYDNTFRYLRGVGISVI